MPERGPRLWLSRQRLSSLALALVVVFVVAGLVVGDHLAHHATAFDTAATSVVELRRERAALWICALGALSALVLALVHERSQARPSTISMKLLTTACSGPQCRNSGVTRRHHSPRSVT